MWNNFLAEKEARKAPDFRHSTRTMLINDEEDLNLMTEDEHVDFNIDPGNPPNESNQNNLTNNQTKKKLLKHLKKFETEN